MKINVNYQSVSDVELRLLGKYKTIQELILKWKKKKYILSVKNKLCKCNKNITNISLQECNLLKFLEYFVFKTLGYYIIFRKCKQIQILKLIKFKVKEKA